MPSVFLRVGDASPSDILLWEVLPDAVVSISVNVVLRAGDVTLSDIRLFAPGEISGGTSDVSGVSTFTAAGGVMLAAGELLQLGSSSFAASGVVLAASGSLTFDGPASFSGGLVAFVADGSLIFEGTIAFESSSGSSSSSGELILEGAASFIALAAAFAGAGEVIAPSGDVAGVASFVAAGGDVAAAGTVPEPDIPLPTSLPSGGSGSTRPVKRARAGVATFTSAGVSSRATGLVIAAYDRLGVEAQRAERISGRGIIAAGPVDLRGRGFVSMDDREEEALLAALLID
jgi:hypothetical protein